MTTPFSAGRPHADAEVVDLLRYEMREGFRDVQAAIVTVHNKQDVTNGRVGRLEIRNAWLSGALAALGFVLGLPAVIGSILGVIMLARGGL
jgi:hypothetical protein